MSADSLLAQWIADRDAVLDAAEKGFDRPTPASVINGSWAGGKTSRTTLGHEASVLRCLQLAIAREPKPSAPVPPPELDAGGRIGDSILHTHDDVLRALMDAADTLQPVRVNGVEFIPSVVHAVPESGQNVVPCCGRLVFDLPMTDRMTADPAEVPVTCKGAR